MIRTLEFQIKTNGHGTNNQEEDQQTESRNQDQNINTQYQTHDQYTELITKTDHQFNTKV